MRRVFVFILAALLPSYAMSQNPLSEPDTARLEPGLLGVWRAVDVGEGRSREGYGFLFVGKARPFGAPAGVLEAVIVSSDVEDRVKFSPPFLCFATPHDGRTYLNLMEVIGHFDPHANPPWKNLEIQGYMFAKYTLRGDDLEFWLMRSDALKDAVKKGALKGTVEKGLLLEGVKVTASSEELRRFIASADEGDLFPDKTRWRWKRVK